MRRADRLFRLVQLLRDRPVTTGAWLADSLQVSLRTVYRDIRDLEDSGVPIEGEAGVGYRLARGYELPPMTFNAVEIEVLVAGARMVQAWGDPELGQAAEAALAKVREVLPHSMNHLTDGASLYAPRWERHPGVPEALGPLRRAIHARRRVTLSYRDAQGQASTRCVWPLGLLFWGRRWTLVGWCELRQGGRHFRVDRIDACTQGEPMPPAEAHPDRTLQAVLLAEDEATACEIRGGVG
ncbi:MAG: YafY family protein [Myxococcota bacterium]